MNSRSLPAFLLLAVAVASCSDERIGAIGGIKGSELSREEKIEQIADIAAACPSCGDMSVNIAEDDEGHLYTRIEYTETDFSYSGLAAMRIVVKSALTQVLWRMLRGTQSLADGVTIEYYGNVQTLIGTERMLVFQLVYLRSELDAADGFYELDPYNTGAYDLYESGSDELSFLLDLEDRVEYQIDNSEMIAF